MAQPQISHQKPQRIFLKNIKRKTTVTFSEGDLRKTEKISQWQRNCDVQEGDTSGPVQDDRQSQDHHAQVAYTDERIAAEND